MPPDPELPVGRLRRVLSANWPLGLAFLFFAFLPLSRAMELPLSIFALSLALVAPSPDRRADIRAAATVILPLFLALWLPMLLSSLDSLDPAKSWRQTLPSLRFLPAALAIAVLMRTPPLPRRLLQAMTWLLLFWAADGYFQLAFGRDLFGVPMNEERLNALFYDRAAYYGPTLAILSPLAFQHMRGHWPMPAWLFGFAFILGAVLISGMRAAWVMMAVVMTAFMVSMMRERRLLAWALPVVAALTVAMVLALSPLLQQRLHTTSLALLGTEQALDEASSYRLPIFRNAWAMYLDHPVNGIGVRAMRAAYPEYAGPDDPHILDNPEKNRAHHAHNLVLEFAADTGSIGLLGLAAAFAIAWRLWRRLDAAAKEQAFPYAVALLALAFPLNSYFAFFGVYTMSLAWVLIGLMTAAARQR